MEASFFQTCGATAMLIISNRLCDFLNMSTKSNKNSSVRYKQLGSKSQALPFDEASHARKPASEEAQLTEVLTGGLDVTDAAVVLAKVSRGAADAATGDTEATGVSDADILEGIRTGEQKAFRMLVQRYQRLVYSIAYGFTANHGDADDVVQQVFIRFFEKKDRVRKASALKTYLARMTTNLCIDRSRKAKRRKTVSLDAINTEDALPQCDLKTPEGLHKRQFVAESIKKAMAQLSWKQRKVVVLSLLEGFTYAEIAEVLKCREVTVRTHLYRARKRLQKMLEPHLKEFGVGFSSGEQNAG